MIIKKSEFVTSLEKLRPFPGKGLCEVAMAGKSNVGKSSMINCLAGKGKLARTSGEPGKTRLINFYRFNDEFLLVDLPGYGFAKVSKAEKERWAGMIEGYLEQSDTLLHVLHLVDIRHKPTENDIMMADYLRRIARPFTVVATKADKLSKAQRFRMIPEICRALTVQPWEVIMFSAQDGTGREALLAHIEKIVRKDPQS